MLFDDLRDDSPGTSLRKTPELPTRQPASDLARQMLDEKQVARRLADGEIPAELGTGWFGTVMLPQEAITIGVFPPVATIDAPVCRAQPTLAAA